MIFQRRPGMASRLLLVLLPVLAPTVVFACDVQSSGQDSGADPAATQPVTQPPPQAKTAAPRAPAQPVSAPLAVQDGAATPEPPGAVSEEALARRVPGRFAPSSELIDAGDDERASIYSPNQTVDFGEVLQGEVRSHTFIVGNRGTEDLEIRQVTPTCGCTVASLKTPAGEVIDPRKYSMAKALTVLKPGETCEITAEFNSGGQSHSVEKHINVTSSDNIRPALPLKLKATILQPIQLDPPMAQFGDLVRGETRTVRVTGILKAGDDLNVTGWAHKPDYVEVEVSKGDSGLGANVIQFDVRLLGTAPLGYVNEALVATTDHPKLTQIRLPLYANIKSEVTFDSGAEHNKERIDFGVIPFGESLTRVLEITNTNDAIPYELTGVDVESSHAEQFTTRIETIEPGAHYKVHVTTSPALDARFFRGTLKLHAKHVDVPEKEISFHGWILAK